MNEWWNDARIFDTLPISTHEYLAILSRLNASAAGHRGAEQRKHARVLYCRQGTKVLLRFADSSQAAYVVKPHNLSATGLSFLHGFYVHAGTDCETALRNMKGKVVAVPGEAVRCRHVSGKTHEIGVEFGQAIDLREFVANKELIDGPGAAKNGPPRFSGRLLYVNDCAGDQELVRSMLCEMGIELRTAATAREALAHIADTPFDIVLTKMSLPDTSGPDLVKALRVHGCRAHIVVVVSRAAPGAGVDAEIEAYAKGCDSVLGTPLNVSRLTDLFRGVLPHAAQTARPR
jgi:CheY-like chemotaxis protein